ncbi:hypothetical protein CAPN002_00180 [Capnocytophaga stomatis]|uniref:hypothetical protein n=1 Tax=Capnocytophaga stomatis TaxID=1848904 RepID=UPI0019519214|nr:hypothetical protein [Capnocytophaga stomatis]GIJ92800.1 hypothetical protein CAPN002_00180 [Capnocytophaga stomatis]
MTAKEKQDLAELIYEFIEFKTAHNAPADAFDVVNTATDVVERIRKHFKLGKELKECILKDDATDEEDKEFLLNYIK